MPIRISQLRTETLRQAANPEMLVTQLAVEFAAKKVANAQAKMRVTQIAIEFPFTGAPAPPGPPPPPPPTRGDTPPPTCQPAPTQECAIQPDLQSIAEACELQGS
jgi:hypothetical protein